MKLFEKLKSIRTPHGNAGAHLFNLFVYFLVATAFVLVFGVGTHAAPAIRTGALGACVTAAVALVGGILVTGIVRSIFSLVQTGRLIQYAGFWFSSFLGLKLTTLLFAGFALTNPAIASFALFAIAFGGATMFGEIPWRGRRWLPIRAKK